MTAPQLSRLGRYEILQEIGKGAMGVVYLARDPLIGRHVALKTFRIADPSDQDLVESRERFIREAQSAGILSHPNIVTIHDVVEEAGEGLTFIAMEYVRGTDLKELLRGDEPFDLPTIADIVWQVAEALEYAHSKGVVHRDVKPANIMLTSDGRVKIADFGIARLNNSNLTVSGQLLGTPNYMAPEQIQGKDVDHRADIFSLGVVLYEMLTRQKPFRGDNLTMVTHRIVYDAFTPLEDHLGEVPPRLKEILERALAKQPAERYQRVGELARDLKQAADAITQQAALNDTQEVPLVTGPAPAAAAETAPPAVAVAPSPPPPMPTPVPAVPSAPPPAPPLAAPPFAPPPVAAPPTPAPPVARPPQPAPPLAAPPAAPPPAPPPPATAEPEENAGPMLSEISEALLAEPPPLPAAPPPPVATARPAAPRSWRRWGIAAALGLVLGLPFNLLLLSWLRPADLPVADASRDAEIRRYHAYLPLVRGAGELLAQGDIDAAIEAYRRAERIAPAPERVRRLREEAERLRVDQTEVARRTAEADLLVSRGEEVLARRRFDEAANIARQALALMPGHPPALDLLGRAEERNSQRPAVPAPRPSLPANQPVPAAPEPVLTQPAPQPLAPVPAPPAPAGDATLRIDFRSEQSSGVLTLYAGQQQLLREPFHFTEKAGFLRTRDVGGHFERTLKLKPGQINLRVYVALDKTRTESLDGNFLPGSSRTLEVRVGSAGELSVQLR